MEPIPVHKGKVAGLNRVNVDTDQIIPKQFLKRVERTGFGQFLFYDWRFKDDGSVNEEFELNRPENQGASILVAGDNFGCGSSREHAPWALQDYGFKVIVASSFADIFYNNCLKNGILPVPLPEKDIQYLLKESARADYECTIDLQEQRIRDDKGFEQSFEIDSYWKEMLINGWDEIDVTLKYADKITDFERNHTA
ncbi:3-isopropylmalate/(R)-2-methylmalate dehydratase small subunit [Melghiribacillus thermohalophilus]|uniref:3-isopropylmalate dehydratase small subunit n=1 Tax=Melghiribacillus thermohalophilus TaxID=1324956 RepID=A0A4R3N967_9BACI|nr:3-isopropylmalate dehydratase small subunit [Melghiribacillus thermohalophilus]TCT25081.1 3-isopropylmalate/(R)-2-methylmalate dehydratase small subunit [Melghiribacillus thermohalophilus]